MNITTLKQQLARDFENLEHKVHEDTNFVVVTFKSNSSSYQVPCLFRDIEKVWGTAQTQTYKELRDWFSHPNNQ